MSTANPARTAGFPETFDFGLIIAAHEGEDWILEVPKAMLSTADLRTFLSALPAPDAVDAKLRAHALVVLQTNVKPRTIKNFKDGERETLTRWFDTIGEEVPYRS